jgi:hypothetical protein
MSWVRIDDGAPLHPKLLAVGPEAAWLWVAGLAFCNKHTTDGRIDFGCLPALYPPFGKRAKALARRLCEAGLWEIEGTSTGVPGEFEGTSWRVHDYFEYQFEASSSVQSEKKLASKLRKQKSRERKSIQESAGGHTVTGAGGHTSVTPPRPDPARPVPSLDHPTDDLRARPNGKQAQRQATPAQVDRAAASAMASVRPPPPERTTFGEVEHAFAAMRLRRTGKQWRRPTSAYAACQDAAEWAETCAATEGRPVAAIIAESIAGFEADGWAGEAGWPFGPWASDPGKFCGPNRKTQKPTQVRKPTPEEREERMLRNQMWDYRLGQQLDRGWTEEQAAAEWGRSPADALEDDTGKRPDDAPPRRAPKVAVAS